MNLALFTYFIPAAFLAVPMYRTMGLYGLLNNQWALILAMVTIAVALRDLGAEAGVRQASRRARRGGDRGRRLAAAALPAGLYPADGAVAGRGRHLCAAARLERISLRVPAAVAATPTSRLPVALGNFLAADDSPWELLMTTGLIYALPPAAIYYVFRRYMVVRADGRRGEELTAIASCPRLSRASTPYSSEDQGVDGRHKAGHDARGMLPFSRGPYRPS